MQSGRPVQIDFRDRVTSALSALEGYPGAPTSLTQLAEDAGMSLPNLTSALRLRRTMTWGMLQRIHRALKLDSLGFDIAVWDQCAETSDEFAQLIRAKRDGDPVELIKPYATGDIFLNLAQSGGFMGIRPGRTNQEMDRPGLVVHPGQSLKLTITLPISGFFKLLCREGGEYFSLDDYFSLTRRRISAENATPLDQDIQVDSSYFGETLFIGLASTEPFGSEWPRGHEANQTVSRETCADLIRSLISKPADQWRICTYSVWTLPKEAMSAD